MFALVWCITSILLFCPGDLRGVAGGDGELGCLCGKAGTSHLCDGSAHSSGCVVNGSNVVLVIVRKSSIMARGAGSR